MNCSSELFDGNLLYLPKARSTVYIFQCSSKAIHSMNEAYFSRKGDVGTDHHGDSGKPVLVEALLLTQVDLYLDPFLSTWCIAF